jgi:hypothetical protein
MSNNSLNIMSGDTSAAQQYLDTFRRSEHLEPEKALIAAILDDAIHEYRKYRRARDPKGKERFREAEQWIMHERSDWIFSFENVCECLGLDPDYIRHGLRETKDIRTEERKRESQQTAGKRAA